MQDFSDPNPDAMTLAELLNFQAALHTAIRSAIRERQQANATPISVATQPVPTIDLARERDEWLANRRRN